MLRTRKNLLLNLLIVFLFCLGISCCGFMKTLGTSSYISWTFSTYLGGRGNDQLFSMGNGLASDPVGNVVVTGKTTSTNFPILNAFQTLKSGVEDAIIVKVSSNGGLVFGTYLGGTGRDSGQGVAADSFGNSIVAGYTTSTDFPTLNASQGSNNGGDDVFIAKFSPNGTLLFATYFGGSNDDWGYGVTVDGNNNILVTGETLSSNFPTLNALQENHRGGERDGFIAKFSPNGTLLFSTYFGGGGSDYAAGLTCDNSGNILITGFTGSNNFPVVNATQASLGGGDGDAFIAKISSDGQSLMYCTYLGGTSYESGRGVVTVDSTGGAVFTGTTASTDFPVTNAYQESFGGGDLDAFMAKLSFNGTLVFATYFGGTDNDFADDVVANTTGELIIIGTTESVDLPTSLNAYQQNKKTESDAYITMFSEDGQTLLFSTYLGGNAMDDGQG
ncbi:MAG: SBBP repeat-containing protein, partial [Candidatus Hodarchaeota archaeon]